MKIIFCGLMYRDVESDLKKMKVAPPVSGHIFQENLIRGMYQNNVDIKVINIPLVRFFPHYPEMLIRESSWCLDNKVMGKNIGFINLWGINYLSQIIKFYKALNKEIPKEEKCVLVCWQDYIANILGMYWVKKRNSNVKICSVIGDLYGENGVTVEGRYVGFKGKIIQYIERKQVEYAQKSDCYCFLTEPMAEAMGVRNKPFVVVEGMYNPNNNQNNDIEEIVQNNEKMIFYAGALEEEYGIEHLLRAFSMIKNDNYSLYIAGAGGSVEEIVRMGQSDCRIKYLGIITPEEVKEYQKKATVLVNPRTSEKEYVKYSFPSKTMECLASGKPFVAHKLPCIPKEYDRYINYPEDETDEGLAKKIIEVCERSYSIRRKDSESSKRFILDNKNPKKMCSIILEMFGNI